MFIFLKDQQQNANMGTYFEPYLTVRKNLLSWFLCSCCNCDDGEDKQKPKFKTRKFNLKHFWGQRRDHDGGLSESD